MYDLTTKNPAQMSYAESFVYETKEDIKTIEKQFFKIGFRLNEAKANNYFTELGYSDIYELAEEEFGFKKTTAKVFMAIANTYCERTSAGVKKMWIASPYKSFSQTQLTEMLPLRTQYPRTSEIIDATWTKEEIRALKKLCDADYEKRKEVLGKWYGLTELTKEHVHQYIEWDKQRKAEKELAKAKAQNPVESVDGQLYLNDAYDVVEYHQEAYNGGQTSDQTPALDLSDADDGDLREVVEETSEKQGLERFLLSPEEMQARTKELLQTPINTKPPLRKLKNKTQRQEFVENENTYDVLVLQNEELGLTIKRVDLANGAKIYRMSWSVYSDYQKKKVERVRYSLKKAQERNPVYFDLEGTSITGIIDYLQVCSSEI